MKEHQRFRSDLPFLRGQEYASSARISLNQDYDVENISGGMSLVASTGSLMLLPLYGTKMLVPSVVARPLEGNPPTVDLVMGYNKSNTSALLKRFLARTDDLVARVQEQNSGSEGYRGATKGADRQRR